MVISIPGASPEQGRQFEEYLSLLLKWNKTHNLTAVRDPQGMVSRHFLESVAVIPHLGAPHSLLDLGCGAGFPGLPIAIMCPDWQITLLDFAHKKITFCQEVARVCGLQNVTTVCARAEAAETIQNLCQFDVVISRATWSLRDFLPIALPYVQRPNGAIYAMKGPRYEEELEQIPPLPSDTRGPTVMELSTGCNNSRQLVIVKYWAE